MSYENERMHEHNEKCRDCKYRLMCGAGCRACACGETKTDYQGIDEEKCEFFLNGWFEKAQEVIERYKDSFPKREESKDGQKEKTTIDLPQSC